ncbi:MAG: hypothetical protein ACI86S_000056 [Paracoccaceae bacterium]|jgi:hypothetical protein
MDVIGGLTAARLAFDLAKDLQGIDRSVDEAEFKLKLAELTSALADTQVALADAKIKISDLEDALAGEKRGAVCPMCKEGRLKVVSLEEGYLDESIQWHNCECDQDGCSYINRRLFDTGLNAYRSSKK